MFRTIITPILNCARPGLQLVV